MQFTCIFRKEGEGRGGEERGGEGRGGEGKEERAREKEESVTMDIPGYGWLRLSVWTWYFMSSCLVRNNSCSSCAACIYMGEEREKRGREERERRGGGRTEEEGKGE